MNRGGSGPWSAWFSAPSWEQLRSAGVAAGHIRCEVLTRERTGRSPAVRLDPRRCRNRYRCRRRSARSIGSRKAPSSRRGDVMLDSVTRAAGQLAGRSERPSQVERFQNLHDLLVRPHSFLPDGWAGGLGDRPVDPGGTPPVGSRTALININEGSSAGRQWAILVATSGQFRDRLRAESHGRRQSG